MVCCSKSIRGIESPGVPVFRRIGNCFPDVIQFNHLLLMSCCMNSSVIDTITTRNGSGIWTYHLCEWMAPCILALGFELYSGGRVSMSTRGSSCRSTASTHSSPMSVVVTCIGCGCRSEASAIMEMTRRRWPTRSPGRQ